MSKPQDSYDFVIVGAGTAGSVLAARLSEDAADIPLSDLFPLKL